SVAILDTHQPSVLQDGSSRAFVWAALADAGIDANVGFGTLIWEQEGSTQHKRYDDIRVGDVVVLHDAKLKGKKGLISYQQQVGSVEEPMFCICSETESKKNKCKVWQVERGHITTESYRLEDLQSGLVRVSHVAGKCDATNDAHDRFSLPHRYSVP
ncbi:hypothetical protein HD553DRAFT_271152, partial [Filobasidium floriforme]|uniref:uncharacterized protein n=1 Tax=Filobasidium floriforme TaxID=5210 RepID=UPI001E8E3FBC